MAHEDRQRAVHGRGRLDDTGGEGDGGKKAYYHLTLLAENNEGYRNLIQLSCRAFLEGYYCKPKVDWELLADHSRGRDRHTGCLGGHVLQACSPGDYDEALAKAGRLQDIFGRDNLFVELQDHGIAEQHRTNPQLVEIAKQHRRAAARHQRQPLHEPRRRRGPRRPAVRADRRADRADRRRALQVPAATGTT